MFGTKEGFGPNDPVCGHAVLDADICINRIVLVIKKSQIE